MPQARDSEKRKAVWDSDLIAAIQHYICKGYGHSANPGDGYCQPERAGACNRKAHKFCATFWAIYWETEKNKVAKEQLLTKYRKEKEMEEEKKEEQALVRHEPIKSLALPMSIAEIEYHSTNLHKAGLLPAGTNVAQAAVIIQTGREIGLGPMQSIRNFSIIRGRICPSVQLQLALARRDGLKITEQESTEERARVVLERNGEKCEGVFTLEDAKKADLLKPGGSYSKYGAQMLWWRAAGIALRRLAPDSILGFYSPEEVENFEDKRAELQSKVGEFLTEPAESTPVPAETPKPASGLPLCPFCGRNTLMKSKTKEGYFCMSKKGGCGAEVALADLERAQKPKEPEGKASQLQLNAMKVQYSELDSEGQQHADSALLNEYQVTDIKELTVTQGDDFLDRLTKQVARLKAKQRVGKVGKLAGEPANEPEAQELFEEGT